MSWQKNIPLSTDQISQSQSDLLGDFRALDSWINVDHINPTAGANQGMHNQITFPQVTPSTPMFPAGYIGLFNQNYTKTTVNELYINKQDGTQIPFSASGQATNGWTYLPSGILLCWGEASGNGTVTVTLSSYSFPTLNGAYSVQITQLYGSAANNVTMAVVSLSTTTLVVQIAQITNPASPQTAAFKFLIIGS